jgi:dephospho-CoA kinase
LKSLFNSILLVYIPREEQIKRLVKKDSITREMAINILTTQMAIEKIYSSKKELATELSRVTE